MFVRWQCLWLKEKGEDALKTRLFNHFSVQFDAEFRERTTVKRNWTRMILSVLALTVLLTGTVTVQAGGYEFSAAIEQTLIPRRTPAGSSMAGAVTWSAQATRLVSR